MPHARERRFAIGAEPTGARASFRVWAPQARRLRVVFPDQPIESLDLTREASGYFSGTIAFGNAGHVGRPVRYQFQLDDQPERWPDPASRFQPSGPGGPSEVIDPSRYTWDDGAWLGPAADGHVFYEMHIGTFTPEGTWRAAQEQLRELAELGVTVLEIMPISEFAGRFGWSYDPVNLFAPYHGYGAPGDLCRFIDEAHRRGIAVILDVVYNHFSPLGERLLRPFSANYFSVRHENEWGAAPNFDDNDSAEVRQYFLTNVAYWISEYHFDGLRIDATQAFHDDTSEPIVSALVRATRQAAAQRRVLVVGENEPQHAELLREEAAGGMGYDMLWNDDFHHSAMVRLTGRREAYYCDYTGSAEELVAAVRFGFLFQGQRYAWQRKGRGTPAFDRPARQFLNFLQNHDQLANSATATRIDRRTSPARLRAMTALWLLAPQTPMFFQGQEFAASSPFFYFNDSEGAEADQVRAGRIKFLNQFRSLDTPVMRARSYDPCNPQSFERSKVDVSERQSHAATYALHRDLLRLRREDVVFRCQDAERLHGFALAADALALRFVGAPHETRLVVVNFATELFLPSIANPLVAPPARSRWRVLWSSEDPAYGGCGTPPLDTDGGWRIPAEAAVVLTPGEKEEQP